MRNAALIILALFGLSASAHAAEILNFPKSAPTAKSDGLPATCLEWTDGCRVCLRSPDGSDSCSNIGIACLPGKPRCTRP